MVHELMDVVAKEVADEVHLQASHARTDAKTVHEEEEREQMHRKRFAVMLDKLIRLGEHRDKNAALDDTFKKFKGLLWRAVAWVHQGGGILKQEDEWVKKEARIKREFQRAMQGQAQA